MVRRAPISDRLTEDPAMTKSQDSPKARRVEGFLLAAGLALGIAALLLAGGQTAVITIAGTL